MFSRIIKLSKVIPVFKSGAKCDLSNYCPISLLSEYLKCLKSSFQSESCLSSRNIQFYHQHNMVFVPSHLQNFSILDIVFSCFENINDKLFTGPIIIDLKKAFDSVTHSILLQKLEHYSFRGNVFILFSSYLSNRQQYASFNNVNSSTQYIKYGVPQDQF